MGIQVPVHGTIQPTIPLVPRALSKSALEYVHFCLALNDRAFGSDSENKSDMNQYEQKPQDTFIAMRANGSD